MADLRSLARHLRDCRDRNLAPRTEAVDAKLWFLALDELIRRGALDDAAHAAPHLSAAFPDSVFIRRLAMLLARIPPPADDPSFAAFVGQKIAALEIVPHAGAETVLFAFCGRHGSLGMPIQIAHRWFGGLGVHVVYLRDPAGEVYASGLTEVASDRPGTVRGLRAIVDDLGASRIVCYGNSSGGFAALLYGLELPAAAVLVTNAVTIFPVDRVIAHLGRAIGGPHNDVQQLVQSYRAAITRPRTHFVYAAGNADDTASAMAFSGIDGVSTEAVLGCDGHDAHATLIEHGRFGALLSGFVAGWPADKKVSVRMNAAPQR